MQWTYVIVAEIIFFSKVNNLLVEFQLQIVGLLFLEELDADLFRDDLSADEIFLGQAQPHLFQNEFHLEINIPVSISFKYTRSRGLTFSLRSMEPYVST